MRAMSGALASRRIVLGVTGGIAAYKAVYLARELVARGAEVRVVMTDAATKFIGPTTFGGLLGRAPLVDLWDPKQDGEAHVELARWGELMVIAPTTANTIAKLAHGLADDALTNTALCFGRRPLVVAPAMHAEMWDHEATVSNVRTLTSRGVVLAGPTHGLLASGETGWGRMVEPLAIADVVTEVISRQRASRDLEGRSIVVTAGPTHEPLDPVRFLGNRSSGKMGFAVVERAIARGARVTLVRGPVALPDPVGASVVHVTTALEMEEAVGRAEVTADAIVMAAAVADYRPREVATQKLKKHGGDGVPEVSLVRNPDILAGLGARRSAKGSGPVLIGFAVESERLLEAARKKLVEKKVDLVVANDARVAFEGDDNEVTLVGPGGDDALGRLSKRDVADRILDRVVELLAPKS